ncbi:MAG: T9SS type A sorting domain-containing protein [Ignavibacteriales bacterium]|nr:T9SS type A sorting domain-containing protein [Ignavibacteriales bacterium]
MKRISTIIGITVFILSFLGSEKIFSQTILFYENFENGAKASWGTYYKNQDMVIAQPMAQAPKVLTGGANYVGWLQDVNGDYSGSAVAVNGDVTLQNYSIEADVYCYYYNSAGSAYTGLVVYADSSKKDFFKLRADFDSSDRINLSGLKSDPNTYLPLFSKDFKGVDNPGIFPTTDSWHKMKVEVRTITSTKVGFWCYFDGHLLTGCPIYYENATANIAGRFGLYSFQMDADGIASYFDNIYVTQLTPTSVEENSKLPTEFSLLQNYPNPFNPETQISYKLSAGGFISLSVYDLLGREIKTLVSKEQPAGYYSVSWNGKNEFGNAVPSGVYMYSLKTSNFYESKKMILMK